MDDSSSRWPVLHSLEEAGQHDPETPALIEMPGHLARPALVMLHHLYSLNGHGQVARGLELLLIALAENDSSCMLEGLVEVQQGAFAMVRASDPSLPPVPRERGRSENARPYLKLLSGRRGEPQVLEATEMGETTSQDSGEHTRGPGGAA